MTTTNITVPPIRLDLELVELCVRPVEIFLGEHSVGHGTSIVWKAGQKLFLVTNWHNFSLQHVFTGKNIHSCAARPDRVKVGVMHVGPRKSNDLTLLGQTGFEIPLLDDGGNPRWLQHRDFLKEHIDVAAIVIDEAHVADRCLNQIVFSPLHADVGSQAFIVGYPMRGQSIGSRQIVWKGASIATRPHLPWDGKRAFLVDATATSGMSGSPVVQRIYGPALLQSSNGVGERFFQLHMLGNPVRTNFLGVYSAHLNDSEGRSINLGVVWRSELINEIIDGGIQGTYLD
ncbi:MAG: trypsin-like peptidase domain-containing protein [Beijerinckiaceae bacterium]